MDDINRFELVGNVGRLRISDGAGGHTVANLNLATHRPVRDRHTNQTVERTEWHDVVAFDELAEQVREAVAVGTRVRVAGYMRTSTWIDGNGERLYKHECVASELTPLSRETQSPSLRDPSVPVTEAATLPSGERLKIHRI